LVAMATLSKIGGNDNLQSLVGRGRTKCLEGIRKCRQRITPNKTVLERVWVADKRPSKIKCYFMFLMTLRNDDILPFLIIFFWFHIFPSKFSIDINYLIRPRKKPFLILLIN
jgi:hypothetical protein